MSLGKEQNMRLNIDAQNLRKIPLLADIYWVAARSWKSQSN